MRATLDRNDLLGRLDGIGHGVVAARKAERSLWYGNSRVAKMLTEVQEHPLALSIRARASYLLGDVASASALNEHLLSSVRLLGPLHLEALLLAYETSAIHHQFVTRDLLRAYGRYEAAEALARLLRMPHKATQLRLRNAEVAQALASPGAPIAAPKPPRVGGDDGLPVEGAAPSDPDLDRLRRALDHHRNGELFLAGHELDAPPRIEPGRDELAWWSCLALEILAGTGDAAVARPRLAFDLLAQLRARRPDFAMERSHNAFIERLVADLPLGFALAVSHPELADWRYALRLMPIAKLAPPPGIFVDGRKVVTLNWRIRDDLMAQISAGRLFRLALRTGARPGSDREWRRLHNERLPRAGLEPEALCSVEEYDRGLAALQSAVSGVAFTDVLAPLFER